MRDKKLKDVLPKLAQIMAKDFRDFSDEWKEVLKTYADILRWLNDVLERRGSEIAEKNRRRNHRRIHSKAEYRDPMECFVPRLQMPCV